MIFALFEHFSTLVLLVLLVTVGVYLSVKTNFIQLRVLYWLFKFKDNNNKRKIKGDLSSFQALMTGLAGAVGTGNIVGIATALTVGGYGALFWMWVVSFFGMATAFTETVLSVKYRIVNKDGEILGGPMITLERGLKMPVFAKVFAVCCIISSFGYNMVQSNAVVSALTCNCNLEPIILAVIVALICGWVLFGGIQRVGKAAGALVPLMMLIYVSMCLFIIISNYDKIPQAFSDIINYAFNGHAVTGGFAGTGMIMALQSGAKYGIFANEAGLGSSAIANASAKVEDPVTQGKYAILGIFLSTMLLCTMTGLVLIVTNVLGEVDSNGVIISGTELALLAFSKHMNIFSLVLTLCLILFAFTTVIGWSHYGAKCVEYIIGIKYIPYYKVLVVIVLFIGAMAKLDVIWGFAHLANSLMFIPNLIAVILLSHELKDAIKNYIEKKDIN